MHAAGLGLSWVVFYLGGLGLPMAVPPQPETPLMANIAPEEVLYYMSSAGIASPEAGSSNQTEQLLAEAEVQKFLGECGPLITAQLARSMKSGGAAFPLPAEKFMALAKLPLTLPMAVYVSSVENGPDGPVVRGGAIIKIGEDAAAERPWSRPSAGSCLKGPKPSRLKGSRGSDSSPRLTSRSFGAFAGSTSSSALATARSRPC